MKTRFVTYLAIFFIALGTYSCSKSSSYDTGNNPPGDNTGTPGANEVWLKNSAFVPSTKTITVGTTITWTNKDASTHDVKSGSGLFASPDMGQNALFSYTFSVAGTYNYSCIFHPGMNGTIVVQ